MNRIDATFKKLRARKRKAFIAYVTAGDPNLKATEELIHAFASSGVDIVEIGVPFSDPLADGPTIQAASQRALKNRVNIPAILAMVKRLRRTCDIPLALMTYYNPVFHYNDARFMKAAKAAGVDGVIIPDLPPEEAREIMRAGRKENMSTIFFIAPTTTTKRMGVIDRASTGFIYYVSVTGVTGARAGLAGALRGQIKKAKARTTKPLCVGFGVSSAAQVKEVARFADGVIVGSAIVNQISKHKGPRLVKNVSAFVRKLSAALHS